MLRMLYGDWFDRRHDILLMVQKSGDHQVIWRISRYLQGLIHSRWLFGIFSINSKDSCHQPITIVECYSFSLKLTARLPLKTGGLGDNPFLDWVPCLF